MRPTAWIMLGLASSAALYAALVRRAHVVPGLEASVAQETVAKARVSVGGASPKQVGATAQRTSTKRAAALRSVHAAPAAAAAPDPEKLWDPADEGQEGSADDRELLLGLFELFEVPEDKLLELRCQSSTCRLRIDAREIGALYGLSEHVLNERYAVKLTQDPMNTNQVVAYVMREELSGIANDEEAP